MSIEKPFGKFLSFVWNDQVYQFTCLPQGLTSSPRIFTKLLKPVFSHLRSYGVTILGYIDDSVLVADSANALTESLCMTTKLFDELGLTVHTGKSVCILFRLSSFRFLFKLVGYDSVFDKQEETKDSKAWL